MSGLGNTAPRDANQVPALLGTSSSNGEPVTIYADPITHRLKVDTGGSGTSLTVTDGITTVTSVTTIDFTSGAVVTDGGGGTAEVAVSGGSSGITIGTTTITSGTDTRILYDNAGVVGEYTLTGTGTVVVMANSPTLITPNIGVATGTSLDVSGVLESGANGGTGGQLKMFGATSGDVTLKVAAAAGTATVFQLPADNGTNTYVLQTNGSGITSWVAPATGTVTSVSGTANRITSTGGATPVIDIAATYVGQTSITTLGTVTTGTWSAGAIIGRPTMTLGSDATGDIYYRDAGGQLTRLGIGSSTNVLTVSGGLPSWAAAPAASLVVGTTTITSGTTTRILYDNGGVLGEYTLTGTGTVVVMQTSPSLLTSLLMDSGFVLNWASSNVVITHTSGILTMGTGEMRITTAGTNTASVITQGSTNTLANKTIIATTNVVEEITTTASSSTPTPTGGSLRNLFTVTALATGATFGAPSGSPVNGNRLVIRIKDSGSGQTLAYNGIYRAIGVTLPTTIGVSKTIYLGAIYNGADSTWDVTAVATQA